MFKKRDELTDSFFFPTTNKIPTNNNFNNSINNNNNNNTNTNVPTRRYNPLICSSTTCDSPQDIHTYNTYNNTTSSSSLHILSLLWERDTNLTETIVKIFQQHQDIFIERRREVMCKLKVLRDLQEEELSSLLTMGYSSMNSDEEENINNNNNNNNNNNINNNNNNKKDQMMVRSNVTEKVVRRHAEEIKQCTKECHNEILLIKENISGNFNMFLSLALDGLMSSQGIPVLLLLFPRLTVRRPVTPSVLFTYQCGAVHNNNNNNNNEQDEIAETATNIYIKRLPQITAIIQNPLKNTLIGARPKDISISPIIIDISTNTTLRKYIRLAPESHCCDKKVKEHLRRILVNKLSVLLIIGDSFSSDSDDCNSVVLGDAESNTVELLLQNSIPNKSNGNNNNNNNNNNNQTTRELSCGGVVMTITNTTSLWGANTIIRVSLSEYNKCKKENNCAYFFESLLNFISIWSADMFSIAISISLNNNNNINNILSSLVLAIARVQMELHSGRYTSGWSTHLLGYYNGECDYTQCTPVVTIKGKTFNLPISVRVFLPCSDDMGCDYYNNINNNNDEDSVECREKQCIINIRAELANTVRDIFGGSVEVVMDDY